ncbi:MAG: phage holin family protein [Gibbsiella quercinecans]|uniref:phage holin family protein n=1 Tax=Gibbsiella quercinecans TaxID=929813 RepID=UPI00337CCEC2
MAEYPQERAQGPAKGLLDAGQRIITILVSMVETRLRLVAVELEEEKANLIQLILMAGLTLLFTAFGLMSLLILIFWAVEPEYRLIALGTTTAVLLFLALVGLIWTLVKARRTTLLSNTRKQLELDRAKLEGKAE